MRALVTGAAGFIGSHTSHALLDRGWTVVGLDNLNAYYSPTLKRDRLARLTARDGFSFAQLDIADHDALKAATEGAQFDVVVHLAAQAGVRYSLQNPFAYARSNLTGHLSVLELVRAMPRPPLLIYASSSSVYGDTSATPFSEEARVDRPVSLYAATKRADELMSESYASLYGMRQIGLRFFTVYGPWGRPDMAYWTFTEAILEKRPIHVFNHGHMERDFTYIDDIIDGLMRVVTQPPNFAGRPTPHRIYNIGNNAPVRLADFIAALEAALGAVAEKISEPMQPGDVHATYANIAALQADYGFVPRTPLREGLGRFVAWLRDYREQRGTGPAGP